MSAPAPGPLAEQRAAERDPLRLVELFAEEARRTNDPGFNTLAENALQCAEDRDGRTPELRVAAIGLMLSAHRFEEAEAEASLLLREAPSPRLYMLRGDALKELGRWDEAATAFQVAVDQAPGAPTYGRIGWLRWAWGDLEGAIEMFERAVLAADPQDPELLAWSNMGLGWMHALAGLPAPELDRALQVLPEHAPSRFYRGRLRLHQGDAAGALEDLRLAGPSFETQRALAELDPSVNLSALCASNPRSCASWLVDSKPKEAADWLAQELRGTRDPLTRIAAAYANTLLGQDTRAEVLDALSSGTRDPRALLQAGLVLQDPAVLELALSYGPGLLPSERALAAQRAQAYGTQAPVKQSGGSGLITTPRP